jgi:hypothetical protein
MSTDKATPRPWSIKYEFNIFGPDKRLIAACDRENVANAVLIVKAVNLHDELLEALEAYQNSNPLHHDGDAELYHLAEPVLAKAKEVT